MVAFSGRQSEPRKGEICVYPHRRGFGLLASTTKVFVVEVGNLKLQNSTKAKQYIHIMANLHMVHLVIHHPQ